jgi:hypothetical protein
LNFSGTVQRQRSIQLFNPKRLTLGALNVKDYGALAPEA